MDLAIRTPGPSLSGVGYLTKALSMFGDEDTESFVHGLCQGFQKRGVPRALLYDSVPRHRIAVLCPCLRCGRVHAHAGLLRDGPRVPPHNFWAGAQG